MAKLFITEAGGKWSEATAFEEEGTKTNKVPTAADDVAALASGKSGNLKIEAAAECRSLDLENYKATLSGASEIKIGTTTLPPGSIALRLGKEMTLTFTGKWLMISTNTEAEQFIYTNGIELKSELSCQGTASKYKHGDNCKSSSTIKFESGGVSQTWNANGFKIECNIFIAGAGKGKLPAGSEIVVTGTEYRTRGASGWEAGSTGTTRILGAKCTCIGIGVYPEGPFIVEADGVKMQESKTIPELVINTRGKSVEGTIWIAGVTTTVTNVSTNATSKEKVLVKSSTAVKSTIKKAAGAPTLTGWELENMKAEGATPFIIVNGVDKGGNENFTFETVIEEVYSPAMPLFGNPYPPWLNTPRGLNQELIDPTPPFFQAKSQTFFERLLTAAMEPKATLLKSLTMAKEFVAKLELKATIAKSFTIAKTLTASFTPTALLTKVAKVSLLLSTAKLEAKAILTKAFTIAKTLTAAMKPTSTITKQFFNFTKTLKASMWPPGVSESLQDTLKRPEEKPLSNGGKWIKLSGSANTGEILSTENWTNTGSERSEAIWTPISTAVGAQIEMNSAGGVCELFCCVSGAVEAEKNGYRLEFNQFSGSHWTYSIYRMKEGFGEPRIGNNNEGYFIVSGDLIRFYALNGEVLAQTKHGAGAWETQVSAADTSWSIGKSGIGKWFEHAGRYNQFSVLEAVKYGVLTKAFTIAKTFTASLKPAGLLSKAFTITHKLTAKLSLKFVRLFKSRVSLKATFIPTLYRENLFPNPSFEYGTTGWTPGGEESEITQSAGNHFSGTKAGRISKTTDGGNATLFYKELPVEPNTEYTLSFYATSGGGLNKTRIGAQVNEFFEPEAGLQANHFYEEIEPAIGEWVQQTITFTTTNNTLYLRLAITAFAPEKRNESEYVYIDAVQLEKNSFARSYIDGDLAGAHWVGTPGNSASVSPGFSKAFTISHKLTAVLSPTAVLTKAFTLARKLTASIKPTSTLLKAFLLQKVLHASFPSGSEAVESLTPVLDNFNRPDETGLGPNWTFRTPTKNNVKGEKAELVGGEALWNPQEFPENQEVYLTWSTPISGRYINLKLRIQEFGESRFTFYQLQGRDSSFGGEKELIRYVNGVGTFLGQMGGTFEAGDKILARAIGNKVQLYRLPKGSTTWAKISEITDPNPIKGQGYIGFSGELGALVDDVGGGVAIKQATLTRNFILYLRAAMKPLAALFKVLEEQKLFKATFEVKATVSKRFAIAKTLTAAFQPTAILTRLVQQFLQATFALSATFTRIPIIFMRAILRPASRLTKLLKKNLAAAFSPASTLGRNIKHQLAASVSFEGANHWKLTRALRAALRPAATLNRVTSKQLSAALALRGRLAKTIRKALSAVFQATAQLRWSRLIPLQAVMRPASSLGRNIRHGFQAVLTFKTRRPQRIITVPLKAVLDFLGENVPFPLFGKKTPARVDFVEVPPREVPTLVTRQDRTWPYYRIVQDLQGPYPEAELQKRSARIKKGLS